MRWWSVALSGMALAACDGGDYGGRGEHLIGIGLEERDIPGEDIQMLQLAVQRGHAVVVGEPGRTDIRVEPVLDGGDEEDVTLVVATDDDGNLAIAAQSEDEGDLTVRVLVPPDLAYQVAVDEGDAHVCGVEVGGEVAVDEGNARVSLFPGTELEVAVNQGDILLELPPDIDVDLDAAAEDGRIDIDGIPFSGTQSDEIATGELGRGGQPGIELAVNEGNIEIRAWPEN
ncbi:MAG: DUF4097 family beta strand repeat-containing protein [Myxococcota bacterium]